MATPAVDRPAGRLRSTRQAAAVQEILRDADGFRTAAELFDEARRRDAKIGLATIYRYLKLFAEHGTADVVHRADGESQYRLCGQPTAGDAAADHHHHVVCRECGRSVEVAAPEVEAWAENVAAAAGFTDIAHTLEIFGLCPQHSSRRRGRAPTSPTSTEATH